jgi:hypothetical protein
MPKIAEVDKVESADELDGDGAEQVVLNTAVGPQVTSIIMGPIVAGTVVLLCIVIMFLSLHRSRIVVGLNTANDKGASAPLTSVNCTSG